MHMTSRLRRLLNDLLALAIAAWLAGCASGPRTTPWAERDGPEARVPPNLAQLPDAEPRPEPIRMGGPNKPYEVFGREYVPITQDRDFVERGLASWYGRKFHGRRTASGEVYDMYAMTAAHPTLPIPSYVRVRNPTNGREVILRVNDRGPFHAGRVIDLSYTAAFKLDLLRGVAPVEIERITFEAIRTGAWRRGEPARTVAATPLTIEPVVATTAETAAAMALPDATPAPQDVPGERAPSVPARGFWIQLGAFRQRDGATGFQRRVAAELDWLTPQLAVFDDAVLFRLQAGPYASRDEARGAAERVRDALQLVPVIVERR
jgi:rare lipoprotein A